MTRKRKQYFGIFAIFIALLVVFGIGNRTKKEISDSPAPTVTTRRTTTNSLVFITQDNRFRFRHPEGWYLSEDVPPDEVSNKGQFGTRLQTWVVTSFPMEEPGRGMLPQNSAKIDFLYEKVGNAVSLDKIVPCDGKTETCETVTFNGLQYRKATGRLNAGPTSIIIGTMHNGRVLRALALIQANESDTTLQREVNAIISTFAFRTDI